MPQVASSTGEAPTAAPAACGLAATSSSGIQFGNVSQPTASCKAGSAAAPHSLPEQAVLSRTLSGKPFETVASYTDHGWSIPPDVTLKSFGEHSSYERQVDDWVHSMLDAIKDVCPDTWLREEFASVRGRFEDPLTKLTMHYWITIAKTLPGVWKELASTEQVESLQHHLVASGGLLQPF